MTDYRLTAAMCPKPRLVRAVSHDDRRRLADSVEGTSRADFRPTDWSQLGIDGGHLRVGVSMDIAGVESIEPGLLSFGRVVLGAAALALIPAARCRIRRVDWYRLFSVSGAGVAVVDPETWEIDDKVVHFAR
ncbi:MAG: hypothetical protein O6951_04675 [Actinobacteria bacterium]|nr:hypothetical protein [Actinomycetota bacterium]